MKNINLYIFVVATILLTHITNANVIGSDAQNFAPTQDGIDYVTVHASETLEPKLLNFGFFINYAQNTFPAYEGSGSAPSQSLLDKNDSLTSADINFAYGVFKNFQVGLSLPYIITQSIDSSDNLGTFEGSGTSEIRPALKYKFLQKGEWGFATALSANFNRIENNPYLGEDAGPTTNLEFIMDRAWGKWNWALNLGHRWRDPGDPFVSTEIDPLPNQWIFSTATSYLIEKIDTKAIFEIYGSEPTEDTLNLSNRQNSSLEALLGAKHDINYRFAVHAGLGSELNSGTSTPDWRAYVGLNYAMNFNKAEPVYKEIKTPEPATEEKVTTVNLSLPNLEFEFNKSDLTEASKERVQAVIDRIREIKDIKEIRVEGHTDSVGDESYNLQLSLERAATVKNYIVDAGVANAKIILADGFGETRPIADNGNFQGRQANRRVDIIVSQEQKSTVLK